MKAKNIISAVSLMLLILSGFAVSAGNHTENTQLRQTSVIRYEVTVLLNGNPDLNCSYWVILTDESGRYISAPRVFVPGVSKYTFSESAPVWGRLRIANLVVAPDTDPYPGNNRLNTKPDVKFGPFMPGHLHTFLLRPQATQQRDIDR